MPIEDYPLILQALPSRPKGEFQDYIAQMEAGISEGAIANAAYVKAKERFMRSIETVWRAEIQDKYIWNRDFRSSLPEEDQEALADLSSVPNTQSLAKAKRNIAALPAGPAKEALERVMTEVAPILEMVKLGKGIAVKKVPAPKEESIADKYRAPAASGSAMRMVLDELEKITSEAKSEIAELVLKQEVALLNRYLSFQRKALDELRDGGVKLKDSLYTFCKERPNGRYDDALARRLDRMLMQKFDASLGCRVYSEKEGLQAMNTAYSNDVAASLCESFIVKNLGKLASIIEARGDFKEISILGRGVSPARMEGRFLLKFEDGAFFEARTQSVFSYSEQGTPYMRYPLTFHGVVLGNGERMTRISEKKMNTEFIEAKRQVNEGPGF